MTKVFVDSNVLLRFLIADDVEQRAKAKALLERGANGEVSLLTGPPVFFEISWVLRKAYKKSREEVLDILTGLMGLPGLDLTDRSILEEALTLAGAAGMEFADAYVATLAKSAGATELATFNRKHFEGLIDLYPLE